MNRFPTDCIIWATIGSLFSLLVLPFSPWMFHFLPTVTVLHALQFMAIALAGRVIIEFINSKWEQLATAIVVSLAGIYLFFWFLRKSSVSTFSSSYRLVVTLTLVILLLKVGEFCTRKLRQISRDRLRWIIGCPILVLALKFILVVLIPTNFLIAGDLPVKKLDSINDPKLSAGKILYPFSVRLTEGVNRFQRLIASPSGKYIFTIVVDSLRFNTIHNRINGKSLTPTLNKLAKRDTYFSQYRVQGTYTKPSTASLFTGRYVSNHGVLYAGPNKQHALPYEYETLAERLQRNGFTNFGVVMSSLLSDRYNFDQGFKTWLTPVGKYQNDIFSLDQVFFWLLKERPDKSFLYLHLKGAHEPYQYAYQNRDYWKETRYYKGGEIRPTGRFQRGLPQITRALRNGTIDLTPREIKYLKHVYRAQLNYVDEKILSWYVTTLKNLDLFSSSLVTITSDHGEELYDYGEYGHGGFLRRGGNLRDFTIRVPLIVNHPKGVGVQDAEKEILIESTDLTATLLDYIDADRNNLDGKSFLQLFQKGNMKKENPFQVARAEHSQGQIIKSATIIDPPWKLIHHHRGASDELYRLDRSPPEEHPVTNRPDLRQSLRNRLFEKVSSDTVSLRSRIPYERTIEAERENLQGLGYF